MLLLPSPRSSSRAANIIAAASHQHHAAQDSGALEWQLVQSHKLITSPAILDQQTP